MWGGIYLLANIIAVALAGVGMLSFLPLSVSAYFSSFYHFVRLVPSLPVCIYP